MAISISQEKASFDVYGLLLLWEWEKTHFQLPPRIPPLPLKTLSEVKSIDAIFSLTETLGDAEARKEIHRVLTPLIRAKREELEKQFTNKVEMSRHIEKLAASFQQEETGGDTSPEQEFWMMYGLYLMEQLRGRKSSNGKAQ